MEREFKGTKGKWSFSAQIGTTYHEVAAQIWCEEQKSYVANIRVTADEKTANANAKLIANAPDLLKVLQHGVRLANSLPNKESIGVRMFIKAAEKVIEKALT